MTIRSPVFIFAAILMALAFISLKGCGLIGLPFSGVVTDFETGEPIAGAFVVAKWKGNIFAVVHGQWTCYHVEVAVTDEKGQFSIPGWVSLASRGVMPESIHTYAYKPRYEVIYTKTGDGSSIKYLKLKKYIESKYVDVNGEHIKNVSQGIGCLNAGKTKRKLYPIYEAIYEDARKLGIWKKNLEWLRNVAASAATDDGKNKTGEEARAIEKEFLKDNLE